MVKFASVCSLTFVVILILGGCATPQGGSATQQGDRYDWVNLEKYKKPPEKKEVAKKPGLFDWLKRKPEEKKEVAEKPGRYDWLKTEPEKKKEVAAKEPRRYKWREPEETKEIAKKPGLFDWLKRKPEEKKEATAEAGPYEPPKPEEKKVVAEKPGRYDWLKTEPEKKKEAPEKPSPYEPPRPEEKKVVAERLGRYDWLTTGAEQEEKPSEKPLRLDLFEGEPVQDEWEPLGEPGDLDFKLDYWMARGKQIWSVATTGTGWKVSELVYPADTNFLVLTGEYCFAERWFVDGSYGFGDCDRGTGTDTDWETTGDPRRSHLSTFDSTGNASFWIVDLYYRFLANHLGYLDAFLGFQHNKNSFKMKGGQWLIYDYVPYTASALWDSTYAMEYCGVRLGLRGEMPLTSNPEWTLEGSVAYLPWVEAEGKGFWKGRDMTFTQTGGEGDGIDAFVAVKYRPHRCPNLTLDLGYRFMELKTSGGRSRSDEAGYIWYVDWDKTKCRFNGFFFGLAYRF